MPTTALKARLEDHKSKNLTRDRYVIENRDDTLYALQRKSVINFTSNDYLNLANHPDVKKAFAQGIDLYGLGSGASNFISGYFKSHQQLEEAFCDFFNRDRAILFNSGYHANLGVITALANKNSTIIADKLCHASIIDGIVLSRARHYRYRHNDIEHAKALITRQNKALLITESVFSMQGSISDVKKLAALDTTLIVDDAHGMGVLGKTGKGICELQALNQQEVACLITPLGKALGSFGAIVSGHTDIIEAILQFSRTYCYTTALPPAVSHATLTSLKMLREETWRRETLQHLITFFIKHAEDRGLKLVSHDYTPIKCILINCNIKALAVQQALLVKGILISCIRPPTVPAGSARIRISLNCMHTEAQIIQLLDTLCDLL